LKTLDELPVALKVADVALAMNISKAQAYCVVKSKDFPVIRTGSRYVIPKDSFIKWMQNQMPIGTELMKDNSGSQQFREQLAMLLTNQQQLLNTILLQQQSTQKIVEQLLAN
jgi:hypothetical protein